MLVEEAKVAVAVVGMVEAVKVPQEVAWCEVHNRYSLCRTHTVLRLGRGRIVSPRRRPDKRHCPCDPCTYQGTTWAVVWAVQVSVGLEARLEAT